MREVCITFALGLGLLLSTVAVAAEDSEAVSPEVIQNMNQRYDDFFLERRRLERRDDERQRLIPEAKRARQEHAARLEKARQEHVQHHQRKPEDLKQRKQWEDEQAQRAEEREMARRRFVRQKNKVDELRRRGRTVPELKEYDLEGY